MAIVLTPSELIQDGEDVSAAVANRPTQSLLPKLNNALDNKMDTFQWNPTDFDTSSNQVKVKHLTYSAGNNISIDQGRTISLDLLFDSGDFLISGKTLKLRQASGGGGDVDINGSEYVYVNNNNGDDTIGVTDRAFSVRVISPDIVGGVVPNVPYETDKQEILEIFNANGDGSNPADIIRTPLLNPQFNQYLKTWDMIYADFEGNFNVLNELKQPKVVEITANANLGFNTINLVNTTSAAISVTLPQHPKVNDTITIVDRAKTFDTKNCTIVRNGKKIDNLASNRVLSDVGNVELVFLGDSYGWLVKNI